MENCSSACSAHALSSIGQRLWSPCSICLWHMQMHSLDSHCQGCPAMSQKCVWLIFLLNGSVGGPWADDRQRFHGWSCSIPSSSSQTEWVRVPQGTAGSKSGSRMTASAGDAELLDRKSTRLNSSHA